MIADNCQIGLLFGGHRFILFLITDVQQGDRWVHHMQCSDILHTVTPQGQSTPSAIQICIAAFLGSRDAILQHMNKRVGIAVGTRDDQSLRRSARVATQHITKGGSQSVEESRGISEKPMTGHKQDLQEEFSGLKVSVSIPVRDKNTRTLLYV